MMLVVASSPCAAFMARPAVRTNAVAARSNANMGLISAVKGIFNKNQDFLEADPYGDQSTVPINTYKNKSPFIAKVVSTKRIVGPKATGETCHIIMNHDGKMPYWEGQSH